MTKPTVLVVVPSLKRAGAETQSVDLANGLFAIGHRVHLCCFDADMSLQPRLHPGVLVHRFRRRARVDPLLIKAIARLVDDESIEVVLGVMQFAALIGWLAAALSKRRPPVLAAVHTTVNVGRKEEIQDRLIYRRLLRATRKVIFVSERQRQHWISKYPELAGHSHVVHNGIVIENYGAADFRQAALDLRARLAIPVDAVAVSCIAGFRPEKGHSLLIEALSRTAIEQPFLLLAGDGICREAIERQVSAAGLEARVRFLGNIADVRPVIAASNATVLASTAVETFSMAMLESMAMSVPVIAPDIGGLSEAIVDGVNGLLFPVGGVEQLTECLDAVAHNRQRFDDLGVAARNTVAERFSSLSMVEATSRLLSGACQG